MSADKDFVLQLYIDLTGSDLLHFGYWSDGDPVTWASIPAAQERYAAFVFDKIPAGTTSVLEVGCGTGAAAMKMKARGLAVECVSPDVLLKDKIQQKYGGALKLYCARFEDLDIDATYDLVMTMESFEYLQLDTALAQCRRYLKPGGHVLISDMFRRGNDPDYKSFHPLDAFNAAVARHGFTIGASWDITENAAPTIELASGIYHRYAMPILKTAVNSVEHSVERKKRRRRLQYLAWRILKYLTRKPVERIRANLYGRLPRILDRANYVEKVRYMVYRLDA